MKRMHTDEELKALVEVTPETINEAISQVEEGTISSLLGVDGDGDVTKAGIADTLNGKYVKVVTPEYLNGLTSQERVDLLQEGIFVNGTYAGVYNPMFTPAQFSDFDGYYHGFVFCSETVPYKTGTFKNYVLHGGTGVVTIRSNFYIEPRGNNVHGAISYLTVNGIGGDPLNLNDKAWPAYPSTGLQSILCWDATAMAWKEWKDILKHYVAPEYDATATYAVGDLVVYAAALYQCSTDIETAETWDPTHWTSTTLAAVIKALHL